MSAPVIAALIAGVAGLVVGVVGPFLLVNLNRANAVKLLTEAAEKIGLENHRLVTELAWTRRWALRFVNGIYRVLPRLDETDPYVIELHEMADTFLASAPPRPTV